MKTKRDVKGLRLRRVIIPFLIALNVAFLGSIQKVGAELRFTAGIEINGVSDFYGPLSAEGSWVDVRPYGRCWHPGVESSWRPYTNGHWEWTDVGWYWVSDEPWSWACYHYGSWAFDPYYGWVWIPGTEWAPAWVTWRESDQYIGWAPCGPGESVLPASLFVFVDVGHFRDRFRRDRFIVNNRTIINRTTVVKDFRRETRTINGARQTVVVNQGPRMDIVRRGSRAPLTPVPITQVARDTAIPSTVRHASWRERVIQEPSTRVTQQPLRGQRDQSRTYQQPRGREQQPAVVAPRQQAPVITTSRREPPITTTQERTIVTGQQRERDTQRQGLQSGRPVQATPATPRQPAPVVTTPQPSERGRLQSARPQPAPIVPQQRPVQPPPTPIGRERGYPNREQFAPPARNQATPAREQPPRAVPDRGTPQKPQGPPPDNERGRDRQRDRD